MTDKPKTLQDAYDSAEPQITLMTENLKAKAAQVLKRGVLVLPVGTSVVVIECLDEHAQEVRLVAHGEPELVGRAVADALRKLQVGS